MAEQHDVGPMLRDLPSHPAQQVGRRPEEPFGPALDRERLPAIVLAPPGPVGGEHQDAIGGKPRDQVPDVLLDSSHTGGEVVRDHEDSRDLHRYTTP